MRRLTLTAALAAALALAGCTLKTPEGAACDQIGGTGQCPEGQRCGADGTCSVAAVACESPICTASACSGTGNKTLDRCVQSGVCAAFVPETCTEHQTCNESPGSCDCIPSSCDGSKDSFCDAGGDLVACHTEDVTLCHYADPPQGCGVFRECQVKDLRSSECACKPDPVGCVAAGTTCSPDGTAVVTCSGDGACFIGSVAPCPTGEVCGGSGSPVCTCPDTTQTPVAGGGCPNVDALACSDTTLLKCVAVAGSRCNAWLEERRCAVSGLVCGTSGPGPAACVCPQLPPSPKTLYADPTPGEQGIEPNGGNNAICSFKTLAAAVAKANPGDTVKATGASPVLFREPGFTIKSGVAVVGDETNPVDPGKAVIELSGTGTQGVVLLSDASLSGVTVRRAALAAATTGIEVQGASRPGVASLADVRVDKVATTEAFGTGILVSGVGTVTLERVRVESATGSGLEVSRSSSTDAVAVSSGVFTSNGEGVRLVVGDLSLVAPIVSHSVQNGINSSPLAGADANRSLSVSDGLIAHNGANGIYLLAHARLDLERNRICSNTGVDRTLAGNTRKVGGVYCQGNAPAGLVFKGNRIQDNGGDQVLVGASANAWNVSGEAGCSDATTNVLMGLTTGVGLAALGAPVTAKFTAWSSNVGPILNTDYRAISGTIDVGSVAEFCFPPTVPIDCPQ
jgi:hypothetical protein